MNASLALLGAKGSGDAVEAGFAVLAKDASSVMYPTILRSYSRGLALLTPADAEAERPAVAEEAATAPAAWPSLESFH